GGWRADTVAGRITAHPFRRWPSARCLDPRRLPFLIPAASGPRSWLPWHRPEPLDLRQLPATHQTASHAMYVAGRFHMKDDTRLLRLDRQHLVEPRQDPAPRPGASTE